MFVQEMEIVLQQTHVFVIQDLMEIIVNFQNQQNVLENYQMIVQFVLQMEYVPQQIIVLVLIQII